MSKHEFLNDSASECMFLEALSKSGDQQKRKELIRAFFQSVHDRMHPDIEQFCFGSQYLNMDRKELRPRILDVLHLVLENKVREARLMCGKGAGKSWLSTIILAYKGHELLSYVSPQIMFNLAADSPIAIMNMSTNAQQALHVIFSVLKSFIERIQSFKDVTKKAVIDFGKKEVDFPELFTEREFKKDKYKPARGVLIFPEKKIMYVSGHSKAASQFGYGVYAGTIDEFDFFEDGQNKIKSDVEEETTPAEESYQGLEAAITSRFGEKGLLVTISTAKSKVAPNSRRVIEVQSKGVEIDLETSEVVLRPRDIRKEIVCHKLGNIISVMGATWVFKGERREQYITDESNIKDKRDYGCEIPESSFSAFPDPNITEKHSNMGRINPVNENKLSFLYGDDGEWIMKPDQHSNYYIHFDLALTGDNAGCAMAHRCSKTGKYIVDFIMRIFTSKDKRLRFNAVKRIVKSLLQQNFNVSKVTFDGFQSENIIQDLNADGIVSERLSVDLDNSAYETTIDLITENLIDYPYHETFCKEMRYLSWTGKKYDHPVRFPDGTKGSKDLGDAVSGAVKSMIMSVRDGLLSLQAIKEAQRGIMDINAVYIDDAGNEKYVCYINEQGMLIWNMKPPLMTKRSAYITTEKGCIILTVGYNAGKSFIVDCIEEIEMDDDCELTLKALLIGFKCEYVSLGLSTPQSVVDFLHAINVRIVNADQSKFDKAKNKHMRTVRSVNSEIIEIMISAIEDKNLKFCGDYRITKDLMELSSSNYKNKIFTCSIAMWFYYAKQDNRGFSSINMPKSRVMSQRQMPKARKI